MAWPGQCLTKPSWPGSDVSHRVRRHSLLPMAQRAGWTAATWNLKSMLCSCSLHLLHRCWSNSSSRQRLKNLLKFLAVENRPIYYLYLSCTTWDVTSGALPRALCLGTFLLASRRVRTAWDLGWRWRHTCTAACTDYARLYFSYASF